MNNKKRLLCVLLGLGLLMSGCQGKTGEESSQIKEVNYDLSDFKIAADGKENQAYWNSLGHSYAAGDDGYYFSASNSGNMLLYYIDRETHLARPLCDKSNCDHVGSKCNSVFSGYVVSSVWRYKDNLYTIKYSNGQAILVRCALDGSNREELFEIGTLEENTNLYCLAFGNDCVYISTKSGNCVTKEEAEVTLRKRSLDGKEDIVIYSTTEENSVIQAVKCYGNQTFFIAEKHGYKDGALTPESKGLFCYDNSNQTVGKILDSNICDYAFDYHNKQLYYYVLGDGLYCFDIDANSTKKLYEAEDSTKLCQLNIDDQYIYLSNERWNAFAGKAVAAPMLIILNRNGELVNRFNTDVYATCFGDESNLLFRTRNSSGSQIKGVDGIAYIEKKNIETVSEWTEIK